MHYGSSHTVRCELESGHDGLHRWHEEGTDGKHWKAWDGPARIQEDNTRWRWGFEHTR